VTVYLQMVEVGKERSSCVEGVWGMGMWEGGFSDYEYLLGTWNGWGVAGKGLV